MYHQRCKMHLRVINAIMKHKGISNYGNDSCAHAISTEELGKWTYKL